MNQNTCQVSMSGFTPKSFSVKRFCGPANTSIHQCMGIRKGLMKLDLPRESGKLVKRALKRHQEYANEINFLTFSACFWMPKKISNLYNLLDMRNFQEQCKKAFCYQKLIWPFTGWINCSNDLKNVANSLPLASNFKSFSQSLDQFW